MMPVPHIWVPRRDLIVPPDMPRPGEKIICPSPRQGYIEPASAMPTGAISHRRTVTAPFTPIGVPTIFAWWRSDSGLYTDSAKTTLCVNDGDAVGAWADVSGNGHDLLQATAGNKPVYKTNRLNGFPSVLFNRAIPQNIQTATFTALTNYTVITVLRFASHGTNYRRYWETQAATAFLSNDATNNKHGIGPGTGTLFGSLTLTIATWYRLAELVGSSNVKTYNNNAIDLNNANSTSSMTQFAMGDPTTGEADQMDGDIVEMVVYSSKLGTADLTKVDNYLKSRYGL